MIRYLVSVVLLVPLFTWGCSKQQDNCPVQPSIKVGAMVVDKGSIRTGLQVSGVMKFSANTTLAAEVSAQVDSIEVEDGQFVERGRLLLQLDRSKIRQTVEQASANLKRDEASLAFTRSELGKNRGLYESGSVSHSVFDQKLTAFQNAMAQVDADKALLDRATEDLKKTQVTSPIAGVLSKRYVERGDWVSEGKRLFQISDYQRIYLEAFLTDLDVGKLSPKRIRSKGEDAEVTLDAYPGETFSGRLTYIEPTASDNRLFEIRIYVANEDMRFLQGMMGRGKVLVKTISDVLRVPVVALLDEIKNNAENTVYAVDQDKRAKLTQIRIGATNHAYASILSGLEAGDVVVVQGKEVLASGQPLAITLIPNP
jgi:RND family efflux transporter MFP subunit